MWTLISASCASAGKAENPVYKCPAGYVLMGENCRSIHEKNLQPYCGDNELFELHGDKCIEMSKLMMRCDKGELDAEYEMCIDTHVMAPRLVCPHDYQFVASGKKEDKKDDDKKHGSKKLQGYCEREVPLAGPDVCPWGTRPEGKRCASYQKVTPFWNCPVGTQPRGQFCSYEEKYDCSQPIVPISKKGNKKRMLGEKHDITIVEPGLDGLMWAPEIINVKRNCVKETMIPAVMQCPKGSAQEGTDCIIVSYYEKEASQNAVTYETAPVSPVCPADYDYCGVRAHKGNESMCCKSVENKPMRSCANGFVKEDGHCVRQFEPVFVCASSKKLRKGHACEGYDWVPATALVTMYVEDGHKKKHDVVVEHSGKKL